MFQVIQGLTIARINILVDLRLQPAVWDRVMHLPTQFFQRYGVGDLSLRVLGIKTISTILSGTTVGGVLAGIFSLTSFVVKALYDVQLMIFAAVFAVGSAVLLAVLIRVIPVLEASLVEAMTLAPSALASCTVCGARQWLASVISTCWLGCSLDRSTRAK
jgi:ABC-type bacteriocin/lantibiotic exporter with double-glycine peptidase domain